MLQSGVQIISDLCVRTTTHVFTSSPEQTTLYGFPVILITDVTKTVTQKLLCICVLRAYSSRCYYSAMSKTGSFIVSPRSPGCFKYIICSCIVILDDTLDGLGLADHDRMRQDLLSFRYGNLVFIALSRGLCTDWRGSGWHVYTIRISDYAKSAKSTDARYRLAHHCTTAYAFWSKRLKIQKLYLCK